MTGDEKYYNCEECGLEENCREKIEELKQKLEKLKQDFIEKNRGIGHNLVNDNAKLREKINIDIKKHDKDIVDFRQEFSKLKELLHKTQHKMELVAGYMLNQKQFDYVFDKEYWEAIKLSGEKTVSSTLNRSSEKSEKLKTETNSRLAELKGRELSLEDLQTIQALISHEHLLVAQQKKEINNLIKEFLEDNKHLAIKAIDITNEWIHLTNSIVDGKINQELFNTWKNKLITQSKEIEKEIKFQRIKWEGKLK